MLQLIVGWAHNPAFIAIATLGASAAVDSMPPPIATSSRFYLWFYGFAHAIMLHADKFKLNIPEQGK